MNEVMTNKELKACLFDILVDVTDYLDKHNLKYVLASGTLLGAIRHQGFIPWDDDIDIDMPRDDYEKLHALIKTEPIGDNYILESLYNGNSAYPFAKIVDTNTEIINSHSSLMSSLWIDIFPVDGVTQEMADSMPQINKKLFREYMLLSKAANNISELDSNKEKLKSLAAKLTGSATHHGRKIEKYAKRYKMSECPYTANIAWGGIRGYVEANSYFNDRIKVSFEGKDFYAPKIYDEYLMKMYGDYMKLPPQNQRDSHNIIVRRKD